MAQAVHVSKANLAETHIVPLALPPLADGDVRLKIESFSVTANNVTYAVIAEMFGYWNFFPAPDGFGIVPMWGHAVVAESRSADVAVGERLYGYLPMATHLVISPVALSAGQLTDGAPHRQPMSPIYNQYARLAADPEHNPAREEARMLFGPLFKTGFLIEAMFRREGWFGADQLVMTSASSKTAMALAHCARLHSPQIKRVGLTSPGNVAFVEGTGLFDQVLPYDGISGLGTRVSVSVDFAGNAAVLRAVHEQLAGHHAFSSTVGMTHVGGRSADTTPLPGPTPTLFFAPDHAVALIKEVGPAAFGKALAEAWSGFVAGMDGTVQVEVRAGLAQAAQAYRDTLAGQVNPALGIIIHP
jgi:hypothetical protein